MTHQYKISGMTCNNCSAKVSNLLTATPGVTAVDVNLEKGEATVTMDRHVDTAVLQSSLKGSHYTITDMAHPVKPATIIADDTEPVTLKTYLPIFLIFGYILTVTLLVQLTGGSFDVSEWMRHFMAGFFLVFSFFKLLDIPGFAMSYSSYDVIAKKFYGYGYIYPFIELGLGISFLFPSLHTWSNVLTLVVMSVSIIGVIQSMLRKSNFQCACLGAIFKLPLSRITLFEDALMIVMSAVGLWMGR